MVGTVGFYSKPVAGRNSLYPLSVRQNYFLEGFSPNRRSPTVLVELQLPYCTKCRGTLPKQRCMFEVFAVSFVFRSFPLFIVDLKSPSLLHVFVTTPKTL